MFKVTSLISSVQMSKINNEAKTQKQKLVYSYTVDEVAYLTKRILIFLYYFLLYLLII